MAEQDGGMVGEIDAGLTLSRDIRFEDLLCQNPFVQNLYDHLCDWKMMLITIATRRACHLLEKLQKSKYCGEVPATKLAALQKVSFPSSSLSQSFIFFILPPEITLITFKANLSCPPPSPPTNHGIHLVQLYLAHIHHMQHFLHHQPSYYLDHLDHHYDHHCFPQQVLQSEFLNAVREVGSPVVALLSLNWIL